jgi:hypothetical protein
MNIKDVMKNKKEIVINSPTLDHERYRSEIGIIVEKNFRLFCPSTYKILFKDMYVQKYNRIQMCEFYEEELELVED